MKKKRTGAPRKTHCARGHELSGANLYKRRNGTRECRQCSRDRARAAEAFKAARKRKKRRAS